MTRTSKVSHAVPIGESRPRTTPKSRVSGIAHSAIHKRTTLPAKSTRSIRADAPKAARAVGGAAETARAAGVARRAGPAEMARAVGGASRMGPAETARAAGVAAGPPASARPYESLQVAGEIEALTAEFSAVMSSGAAQAILLAMKNLSSVLNAQKTIEGASAAIGTADAEFNAIITAAPADQQPALLRLKASCLHELRFRQGLKTIDLLFQGTPLDDEKRLMELFYRDESHPMDLQRSMLQPDLAKKNLSILKNIARILRNPDLHPAIRGILSDESPNRINEFFISVLSLERPRRSKNILDIPSVVPDIPAIRERNLAYYRSVDARAAPEFIREHFGLPSSTTPGAVRLLTNAEAAGMLTDAERTGMVAGRPFIKEGFCYLRVPDAGNRIVRISETGFRFLQQYQISSDRDRSRIMETLRTIPGVTVTGRTKSPAGIVDKLGRLCLISTKPGAKYQSIADIVDVNGMRITCAHPSQIAGVIEQLRNKGYEILEMDNKYVSIRKAGGYKIIALTVRDPATGNVFELQVATRQSLAVFDLYHNVIYKKDAVRLPVTPVQEKFVLRGFHLSAILETWSLHRGTSIDLASGDFKPADISNMVRLLKEIPLALRQKRAEEIHFARTRKRD
jgi:ppGpp synthetase/RelA/SpoT-type nucleotidyltranferase